MTIDRAELQDAVRKAFGDGGWAADPDKSWTQFVEMGFLGLTVAEAQGGLGLGAQALAAIHYELGRALVPGPMIPQTLVIEALTGTDQKDLRDRAMAGEKMTVGHFAVDADVSSHILFSNAQEIRLIPRDVAEITRHETWDSSRRLFTVKTATAGLPIADGDAAAAFDEKLKSRLSLMLAADSLGGANAILAHTIDYLKTRTQFDRPLAMFQALKHRVADLKTRLAAAEALLWSQAKDAATSTQLGALKAHSCTVYRAIAEEAIQLHGGIGLTQEHHCHLFLKRAMLNTALGGDSDHWEEQAGRKLLEESAI